MEKIRVWRITGKKYADDAFSGEGARIWGGRFNSPGNPAVYTSGSLSLALLENLVQTNTRDYFKNLVYVYADIPANMISTPTMDDLPDGWSQIPHSESSQAFGDTWIKDGTFPVLRIPSVVVSQEFNYMINPKHREYAKIIISKAGPLSLDPRIFGDFSS